MKQLDKNIERKLNWLLAPLVIVVLLLSVDLIFELGMNSLDWIK